MIVRNLTRGTTLATSATAAGNLPSRGIGLLGRRDLPAGEGLLIVPCQSIHSCFMRFRFDAVFFDRDHRVRHLIEAMPPWRFSRHVWRARGVLELPAGTIAATGTERGDQLALEDL
ncbi:MAG TPA: DUF192 domain-containing protein [Dehalococcoidia bacterium]|nr:DUF192 domain-containing protein [Dehalococcoidia bacterium]